MFILRSSPLFLIPILVLYIMILPISNAAKKASRSPVSTPHTSVHAHLGQNSKKPLPYLQPGLDASRLEGSVLDLAEASCPVLPLGRYALLFRLVGCVSFRLCCIVPRYRTGTVVSDISDSALTPFRYFYGRTRLRVWEGGFFLPDSGVWA